MSRDPENSRKLLTEPTGMPVRDAIARRVSCRAYHSTPVPQAHLMQILEAARLAPSVCNQQPWRFAVVRELDLRRRIVEEGFLPGIKMTWAIDAPVHVVIGMERILVAHQLAASVSGVNYPWVDWVDIGIAGERLVLAATELGLGTCWIGWIKPRAVARIVGWPAFVKPVVVITVGYSGDPDAAMPPASRPTPKHRPQTLGENRRNSPNDSILPARKYALTIREQRKEHEQTAVVHTSC